MRQTVLVVEDEVIVRLDISEFLREQGFEVLEASSVEEALDKLDRGTPVALVFTDIQLSGTFDGLALIRYLHRDHPGIKTIATSANLGAMEPPRDLGTFIDKPYLPQAILALINKALTQAE